MGPLHLWSVVVIMRGMTGFELYPPGSFLTVFAHSKNMSPHVLTIANILK
jgi:hypothetical protein